MVNNQSINHTIAGFSLRNEVAGEQCKVTGDGEGASEARSPLGGSGENFGFLNLLRCNFLISDGKFYLSIAAEQKTMHALKWSQNVVLFFEFISNKKSEIKSSNSFTQRLSYASIFSTTKYYTNISKCFKLKLHTTSENFSRLCRLCRRHVCET